MKNNQLFSLRYMEEKDLSQVLKWRNSDRIRKYMFNDLRVTMKEHKEWFSKLDKDNNHYLVFELCQKPVGLVYFKEIDCKNKKCYWGFYLGEEEVPKGTGTKMGEHGLAFAFNNLNIAKVCAKVIAFNEKSIRFHERLGFIKEDTLKNYYFRDNKYEDVICYALFKSDWESQRKKSEEGS